MMPEFLSPYFSSPNPGTGIALIIFGFILATIYWRVFRWSSERKKFRKRSRAVVSGLVAEQFAPHFPEFPTHPGDAKFLGKPIDYIAFKGLEAGKVDEILFIEVKSGHYPRLSAVERSVRETVRDRKVRWVQLNIEP